MCADGARRWLWHDKSMLRRSSNTTACCPRLAFKALQGSLPGITAGSQPIRPHTAKMAFAVTTVVRWEVNATLGGFVSSDLHCLMV